MKITKEQQSKINDILAKFADGVNWDNWENEGADKRTRGTHWDITEILWCKLSWVLEGLDEESEEAETVQVAMDIIEVLQPE